MVGVIFAPLTTNRKRTHHLQNNRKNIHLFSHGGMGPLFGTLIKKKRRLNAGTAYLLHALWLTLTLRAVCRNTLQAGPIREYYLYAKNLRENDLQNTCIPSVRPLFWWLRLVLMAKMVLRISGISWTIIGAPSDSVFAFGPLINARFGQVMWITSPPPWTREILDGTRVLNAAALKIKRRRHYLGWTHYGGWKKQPPPISICKGFPLIAGGGNRTDWGTNTKDGKTGSLFTLFFLGKEPSTDWKNWKRIMQSLFCKKHLREKPGKH